MDTEEVQEKIVSVDFIHEAVPETGDDEEEKHTAQQMNVEQFLQVVAHDKKNQGGQCGQGQADRAFGENGKGGHDIGGPVPAAVFCIAEVEKGQTGTHEQKQCRIGDDRFRQEPAFNAGHEDDGGRKGKRPAVYAGSEPVRKQYACCSHQGRGKPCRKFGKAEQGEGKCQFPVIENRLVIPVVTVYLGREPVTGEDHFLCRQCVIRFG